MVPHHDRRAAPRVQLVIELYGQTVPLGVPITLVNVSLTGMAVRTRLPLPVHVRHCFELTLTDGVRVLLDVDIVRRHTEPDGTYLVGTRFIEPAQIAAVFNRITGVPAAARTRTTTDRRAGALHG